MPQRKHVPAETNGGWGIAALVIGLAVACAVFAAYVHHRTYRPPQDVTWHAKGWKTD